MARKPVLKVRALLVGPDGETYGITSARQPRVLQLPGGGVKPGERLREAIIREVREETGFRSIRILRRVPGKTMTRREDGTREITVVFVVAVSGSPRHVRLTGRERGRALELAEFDGPRALQRALGDRHRLYGRTATARDRALVRRARAAL